jgi:hypothetical protein
VKRSQFGNPIARRGTVRALACWAVGAEVVVVDPARRARGVAAADVRPSRRAHRARRVVLAGRGRRAATDVRARRAGRDGTRGRAVANLISGLGAAVVDAAALAVGGESRLTSSGAARAAGSLLRPWGVTIIL